MTKVVSTQAPYDSDASEIDANATVNHQTEILNGMATIVVMPEQGLNQTSKLDFGALLLAGNHGGFEAKGSRTSVSASPGAVIRKQIIVSGTAIISNATLICSGNTPAVTIRSGGRLVLKNCHISKGDNLHSSATDAYILMETGSYASVVSSVFYGTQSNTGSLVYNQDAVNTGRGSVIGCVNLTDVAATPFVNIAAANVVGNIP